MRSIARKCAFLLVLCASVAARPAPEPRIDLDVRDADVHDVLRLLAETGRVNLVVADAVRGRVTVKLRNVPWTAALEVVLRSHALGHERDGNILLVDTLENLARQAADRAALAADREQTASLVTILVPVSHARAADLLPIVAGMLTPRGTVTVDRRTNTLIVTDVAGRTDAVRARITGSARERW